MTRTARTLCLVGAACVCLAACARRSVRDVGNQNRRSAFVDGQGASSARDAGVEAAAVVVTTADHGQKPRVLAMASAHALITSPTHVYFGDAEDNALLALAKPPRTDDAESPRSEPVRLARRAPVADALAIDPVTSTLAWIASPGDIVLRIPTTGGTPSTVRDRGLFTNIAMHGGDIFFTEAQPGERGRLMRVTGATAAQLGTFEGTPRGIAVDAEDVVIATSSRLVLAPRKRGEVTELARGAGFASPVIDDDWVLTTAVDPKARARVVVRVKKTGGALETIATNVRDAPIAVHKGTLFWFDADRPALLSLSLSAASSRTVSEDAMLERVNAIAVDDDGAFIAVGYGDAGRIVMVPF